MFFGSWPANLGRPGATAELPFDDGAKALRAECMLSLQAQAKIVDIGLVDGFDNADKNAIAGT